MSTDTDHSDERVMSLLVTVARDVSAIRANAEGMAKEIDVIRDRISRNEARADHVIDDHTKRITNIEKKQASFTTIVGGLSAAVGAGISFLLHKYNGGP